MVDLEETFLNEAITHVDIEDVGALDYLLRILPIMAGIGSKNPAVRSATLNKKSLLTP
jgi:hypothetical protein